MGFLIGFSLFQKSYLMTAHSTLGSAQFVKDKKQFNYSDSCDIIINSVKFSNGGNKDV